MADRLEHLDRPVGRFQGSPARRERAQPATARTGRLQPGARGNLVYATGLNATTQLPPRLMGSRLDPTVVRHRCRGPLGTLKRRGKLGRLMQGLLEFLTQLGDPTLYGEDSSLKKTTPLLPELAIFNRFQTILLLTFSNHHHRLQKLTCTRHCHHDRILMDIQSHVAYLRHRTSPPVVALRVGNPMSPTVNPRYT